MLDLRPHFSIQPIKFWNSDTGIGNQNYMKIKSHFLTLELIFCGMKSSVGNFSRLIYFGNSTESLTISEIYRIFGRSLLYIK